MPTSGVLTASIGTDCGSISVTGETLKRREMQKQKNLDHPFLVGYWNTYMAASVSLLVLAVQL